MFVCLTSNAFPKRQILDSPKLKVFSEDNFTFDENGRKFSKSAENTVGKTKLLVMSNFSLSHSVFKSLILQTCKTWACLGMG